MENLLCSKHFVGSRVERKKARNKTKKGYFQEVIKGVKPFICSSFNKCFLNTYYTRDTVLGAENSLSWI